MTHYRTFPEKFRKFYKTSTENDIKVFIRKTIIFYKNTFIGKLIGRLQTVDNQFKDDKFDY